MAAATLVFGWGNPSRGDDALGPLFIERFEALAAGHPEWGNIECLTDFQLQVEHTLDLQGRQRILFVDASADLEAPCRLTPVLPRRDDSFTSHALSPQALLHAYREVEGVEPPPATLLAIRGDLFELGAPLSPSATQSLETALSEAGRWLADQTGAAPPAAC